MSILDQKNSKKQGDVGMGLAIGWFASRGWTVSVPLTDSQDYDLLVDDNNTINRVQVRTTKFATRCGVYRVGLRVCGGNRSRTTQKLFDPKKVDYLFIIGGNTDMYFIPSAKITSRHSLNLGNKMSCYKVSW